MKKLQAYQPIIYALLLVCGVFLGKTFYTGGYTASTKEAHKISEILGLIENRYVDTINKEELESEMLNAILKQLDPHSVFIPAAHSDMLTESLEGRYQGIGVEYTLLDDTVFLTHILPNSPAKKAQLKVGDRLLRADSFVLVGSELREIVDHIKGKEGTAVDLQVLRGKELITIPVKRDEVNFSSVQIWFEMDENSGYIKLDRFASDTEEEFEKAVLKMKDNGIKNLIIDLRGNTGGYLQTAIDILSHFFEDGELLTYTKGLNQKKKEYYASGRENFSDLRLLLLVNERSASASEILSGVIQDYDAGVIIGRPTYGKGLVQQVYTLTDESSLKLTVARYYIPSGRSIQKPFKRNSGLFSASTLRNDSILTEISYKTKNGRLMAEKGGIEPDVFISDSNLCFTAIASVDRKFVYRQFDVFKDSLDQLAHSGDWLRCNSCQNQLDSNLYTYLPQTDSLAHACQLNWVKETLIDLKWGQKQAIEFQSTYHPYFQKALEYSVDSNYFKVLNAEGFTH